MIRMIRVDKKEKPAITIMGSEHDVLENLYNIFVCLLKNDIDLSSILKVLIDASNDCDRG